MTDLLKFLKDEGRYKYRMVSYMKTITNAFESLYDSQTDEDIEIYERIIYRMHKSLYEDYRRLRSKKLTPADSVICLALKLLTITEEYIKTEGLSEATDILRGFHNNIKNKGKYDKLMKTESTLKESLGTLELGKLRLPDIDLYSVEHPVPRTQEILGESDTWGESKGTEVKL